MSNTDLIPIGITATTTFTQVSALLNSSGLTQVLNSPVTSSPGYILNRSSSVNLYVGYGTSAAPTAYATLTPLTALKFGQGMNTSLLWVASASSTVACDFVEGGDYQAVTISGVIGTITLSANEVPKGDGSGNLVATDVSADTAKIYPTSNDGAALGDATHNFSDLFLATGAVINYANGNVAITHSSGILTMGTGELRITTPGTNAASVPTLGSTSTLTNKTLTAPAINAGTIGTSLVPTSDDGAALGDTTHNFSDLFLASGAVINYANGNSVVTHTSGVLTVGTGDLRVTNAGTNSASVVTVGGAQTLTSKGLTTPTINGGSALGATSTEIDQLNDVSAYQESVTAAGAMSVTKVYTGLALVGTGAVTLAAPSATMLGQIKTIEMTADNGDVTFALTEVVGQSSGTTATFNDVGDKLILLAAASKWLVIKEFGITLS